MRLSSDRLFGPALGVLLASMTVAMAVAALGESQTYDEGFHLTAGYTYWKTGDYRLNPEHPPLAKLLAALPLLPTHVGLPDRPDAWKRADQAELFEAFLYDNTIPADTMLILGRATTMLCSLALVAVVALTARALWGAVAGLAAGALCATDPNLIAHGHYITSDVPVVLAILVSALTWDRYLGTGRIRHLAVATCALGGALAIKFSALYLVPVHWIVYWIRRPAGVRRPLFACLGSLFVVAAAYGPESLRTVQRGPLADRIPRTTPVGATLSAIAADLRLPAHPYLVGVWELTSHHEGGHRSYLLGKITEAGSGLYFPTAFAVKTPSAVLVLLVLAGVATVLRARQLPLPSWLLAVYPVCYLALCLQSSLNLGLRHLLPLYPFLYLWIGWAVGVVLLARWRRATLALLAVAAVLHAGDIAWTHPHYTAFFNTFAGGAANGHRYLLDSNLDWGQDVKKLKRWMDSRGVKTVCTSYFGTANLRYYGIDEIPLAPLTAAERDRLDCLAAVSLTNYYDVYTPPGMHLWIHSHRPIATIGHSIWVFDLRKRGSDRVRP